MKATVIVWNTKRLVVRHITASDMDDAEAQAQYIRGELRQPWDAMEWQLVPGWLQVQVSRRKIRGAT